MTVEQDQNPSPTVGTCLLALRAETLIHVGIGQVNGAIDLPVSREQTTGWPNLPAPGAKGSLRDFMRETEKRTDDTDSALINFLFGQASGSETATSGQADGAAGALSIGEGNLLCLPIRGMAQVFYWVTCPAILDRARRLQARLGFKPLSPFSISLKENEFVAPDIAVGGTVLRLEEFQLTSINAASEAKKIAAEITALFGMQTEEEKTKFHSRFLIVSDLFFSHLCRTALPFRMRNALDTLTKTVKNGQLWSEEYLPPQTLMLAHISEVWPRVKLPPHMTAKADDDPKTLGALATLTTALSNRPYIQIGGKETIGCGWFHVTLHPKLLVPETQSEEAN